MNKLNRRNLTRSLLLFVAQPLLFGIGGIATAYDQTTSAVEACTMDRGIGYPAFDGYGGIDNESTSSIAIVSCGAGQDQALDTNDDLLVYVMDLNGDPGMNFGCTAAYTNAARTTAVFTETAFACSTTGGCTSDPGRFASGNANMRFEDIHHGGGYTATVFCKIPPKIGSDYSSLKTLYLDEQ